MRAFEALIPVKTVADGLKAMRGYSEGNLNEAEAALQTFGIRPASAARRSDEIGDRMAARKSVQDERKDLEKRYLQASTPAERARLVARIRAFNTRDGVSFRERISVTGLDARRARDEARRRGEPVEETPRR